MSAIMVLGFRLYYQFQVQAKERQIALNVNALFKASSNLYYANCRQTLDQTGVAQSAGLLDPLVSRSNTIHLNIKNDLLNTGYLSPNWQPISSLVDSTAGLDQGYFVQFSRVLENGADPIMSVTACVSQNGVTCVDTKGLALDPTQTSSPFPNPNPSARGSSVAWVIEVGVKLLSTSPAQWTQMKNDLNAQCVSDKSGGGFKSCIPTPKENGYLVWTRLPDSFTETTSELWSSQPYVKEFKMQYTNDGMSALSGVQNSSNWYDIKNYLCGG